MGAPAASAEPRGQLAAALERKPQEQNTSQSVQQLQPASGAQERWQSCIDMPGATAHAGL
jgi:hypothetical protein